jgi:hypothetical protein
MIQVQLSPEVEARLQAQARAQGVEAERYAQSLIEEAVLSTPVAPRRNGPARDMDAFFRAMSADSEKLPQLPEEAFTRASFYQNHD